MGRNDHYRMGIILVFSIIISFSNTFSQAMKGGEGNNEKLTQTIKARYPVNVAHDSRYTEDLTVVRTYNDSSTIEYNRKTTYYFTLLSNQSPEDGFTKIKIIVDSLKYEFTSGQKKLSHNSQWDVTPPLNIPDYLTVAVPLSKTYTITYSPYNEIVSIDDERLKYFREVEIPMITDSLSFFYYTRYSDDTMLSHIADMQKGGLPTFAVSKDTNWPATMNFVIDGVNFSGNFKGALKDVINGVQFVELSSDSVKAFPQRAYKYGINNALATIDSGNAKIVYKMDVAPNGFLNFTSASIDAKVKGRFRNLTFTEEMRGIQSWEIVERYKW